VQPDAVVIGAGPNGLVAANLLADRGWEVLVLEEQAEPGGAVRSGEVAAPGYRHDLFSAFYPLAAGSGVIGALELGRHGLTWRRARGVVAHPAADGRCALLSTELDETCESLDRFAPGDGDSWRLLFRQWERLGAHLVEALLTPFPPVRAAGRLALALRRDLARFARFGLLPVRRLAEEAFRGEGGGWLLAANALHADLPPEAPGSGLYGWVLCGLGQQHGYPVPEGGASELTAALVRRLESRGGEIRCGEPVTRIEVSGGEARATRRGGPCSPTSARRLCTSGCSRATPCRGESSRTCAGSSTTPAR
jgi:phytoene dehydrogenase-like protein